MISLEPRNYNLETQKGFIALMSAVIISVILLLIATNLSLTSFYGRSNILDFELKERSSALAEACADTAILKLANDLGYIPVAGGEDVFVGLDKCTIESVAPGAGSEIIIHTQSDYKDYFTNLKIIVDSSDDLSVVSWEEILLP